MSIETAERLKKELTDQWVVVSSGVPELRRFEEFTGQVKTVNMNCRALVEFKGSEDIGWYDIDPQFLTVVDAPAPGKKAAPAAKEQPAAKSTTAAPATSGTSGGSPLDKIRAQAGGAAAPAKPTSGGSPLDQIRAQSGGATPAKSADARPTGGSPLDQIRAQSSGASSPAAAPAPAAEKAADEPTAAKESAPPPPSASVAPADTSGMSPLDLIRAQGGFKGDK